VVITLLTKQDAAIKNCSSLLNQAIPHITSYIPKFEKLLNFDH
jgi:hypothetical protein